MSKKYLSLEEAASRLNISTEELNRLRERGEVRGFADRGTWKFKAEDLDELARRRQADSDPDVPMLGGDSDSLLLGEDEDTLAQQPTVIRRGKAKNASDSDVRLVLDDDLRNELASGDSGLALPAAADSDSDVRLADDRVGQIVDVSAGDSASDVKLAQSQSDVQLAPLPGGAGSDSDVRLIVDEAVPPGSDSDVTFIGAANQDIPLSDESVLADESGITLSGDSSIALSAESGVGLKNAGDSGISLERDSGLFLGDSGIALAGDSGISLGNPADSGLSLDATFSEASPGRGRGDMTIPMLDATSDAELNDTSLEVPMLDEESDFELSSAPDSGDETSVIMFEDDMDVDETAATLVKKGGKGKGKKSGLDESAFELEDTGDETYASDDLVEVDEDVFDEGEDLDVFDAADEDFDESFVSGQSHIEYGGAPLAGARMAPVEHDWGTGTFIGLLASTVLMGLCLMMMFDVVRTMWAWGDVSSFNGWLVDLTGGLF